MKSEFWFFSLTSTNCATWRNISWMESFVFRVLNLYSLMLNESRAVQWESNRHIFTFRKEARTATSIEHLFMLGFFWFTANKGYSRNTFHELNMFVREIMRNTYLIINKQQQRQFLCIRKDIKICENKTFKKFTWIPCTFSYLFFLQSQSRF